MDNMVPSISGQSALVLIGASNMSLGSPINNTTKRRYKKDSDVVEEKRELWHLIYLLSCCLLGSIDDPIHIVHIHGIRWDTAQKELVWSNWNNFCWASIGQAQNFVHSAIRAMFWQSTKIARIHSRSFLTRSHLRYFAILASFWRE